MILVGFYNNCIKYLMNFIKYNKFYKLISYINFTGYITYNKIQKNYGELSTCPNFNYR